jgi:ParB/RepB/Spo0J family partition protein
VINGARQRERREIPLALIDDPQLPSRTTMDEQKLEELIASIRAYGFFSVIVVVQRGDRYEVVAGHRRTMAARLAGLAVVPCVVCQDGDDALEAIQFDENAKREDLAVTDEAIWFRDLLNRYPDGGTDGVAARVGQTRAYVEGRLALLNGCPRVFAALGAGDIKIGVAQRLNQVTEDAHRYMLLDTAVRSGAPVGLVTQWVNDWRTIHAPASGAPISTPVVSAGGPSLSNDYFRCRVCGENDNTANMQPVQIHDYCLRQLLDPSTGFFRSKADYVIFPHTRDEALRLVERVLARFPELADGTAAPDERAPR